MKGFTLAVILAAAGTIVAQEPEKLTPTEVMAINQVSTEINKASQDAQELELEIQTLHKGYTYNFQSGQLVKVVPIKTPEAQPKIESRTVPAPETPLPKKTTQQAPTGAKQ